MRFNEIKQLINSDNTLLVKTCLNKLKLVFDEFTDLVDEDNLNEICDDLNITSLNELLILEKNILIEKLNNRKLNDCINKYFINPNKWIRLRKTNDKIELTIKHIYMKNNDNIQKVKETEITVSNFEEANLLLNELGIYKRNFQEKIRYSFKYKEADIEIDLWPMLKPYVEIECDNDKIINEIIEKLDFSDREIVSLNTEELYRRIGVDILSMDTLSF